MNISTVNSGYSIIMAIIISMFMTHCSGVSGVLVASGVVALLCQSELVHCGKHEAGITRIWGLHSVRVSQRILFPVLIFPRCAALSRSLMQGVRNRQGGKKPNNCKHLLSVKHHFYRSLTDRGFHISVKFYHDEWMSYYTIIWVLICIRPRRHD